MFGTAALLLACSDPYQGADKTPTVDSGGDSGAIVDDPGETAVEDTSPPADTSHPDSDGDGTPDDEDCVPDDATIYPGAPDAWYDGVDSDCAGNSDYDQDADGYLAASIGGDDCNDMRADVNPGATDTPYDGVDSDCAGDNDYDADADGDPDPSGGGEDCDDTDASVSSLTVETLDDAIDGDCNGDVDGFRFTALDVSTSTGLQGPRIASDSSYAMVGFLAASTYDSSSSSFVESVGLQFYFDSLDPTTGSLALGTFYWGSSYTFHQGFDFWASDDHQVWAYGLQAGGTRYLLADVYRASDASYSALGWGYPTSNRFDDVELTEQADGSLHLIGCDDQNGYLTWMHASPDGFYSNTDVDGDDLSGVPTDACVVHVEESRIVTGDHDDPSYGIYGYSSTLGITTGGTELGTTAYDIDRAGKGAHEAFYVAEGAAGVHLEVDGAVSALTGGGATAVEAELDGYGNAYVVYADGSATAWFAWGEAGLSMPEVELDAELGVVDEIDVVLTDAGILLVVARGGDEAAWGVVTVP